MLQIGPSGNAIRVIRQRFIKALDKKEDRYPFVDAVLLIAGLVNLIVGTCTAVLGMEALAATTLAAGLALLFASTIERFEFIKLMGVEAKVNKLNEQIDRAELALKKLRKLTEITASSMIATNCKMGRTGNRRTGSALTPMELISLESSVREMLHDADSDPKEVARILRPLAIIICHDMAYAHLGYFMSKLEGALNNLGSQLAVNRGKPEYAELGERMRLVRDFQQGKMNEFHSFELEDYPEKFMEIFDGIPEISEDDIALVRQSTEKFIPGMIALRDGQVLPDRDLWIEAFETAEVTSLFKAG